MTLVESPAPDPGETALHRAQPGAKAHRSTQPYVPVQRGFLYLVAVMDWTTRQDDDALVNTGADSTIIHPYDGYRRRVPFAELESVSRSALAAATPTALQMPFSFLKMALACANIVVRS